MYWVVNGWATHFLLNKLLAWFLLSTKQGNTGLVYLMIGHCNYSLELFYIQDRAYREVVEVCGEGDLSTLNYDQVLPLYINKVFFLHCYVFKVKDMVFLEACVRETLRLRPPLMTMMRMVKTPQVGYACTLCYVKTKQ